MIAQEEKTIRKMASPQITKKAQQTKSAYLQELVKKS